jgi:hypothetical protein
MQNFILPDFLDGSKTSKNFNLNTIAQFCKITQYMRIINETTVKIEFGDRIPTLDGIPLSEFVDLINRDESLLVFLRSYKGYLENNSKNYIVEKNLTNALLDTKLDLKVKYLPSKFSAFIDFKNLVDQDNDIIQGVFIDIRDIPKRNFYMGYLALNKELNAYTIGHLNIPLKDPEESIETIIKKHKEVHQILSDEDYARIKSGQEIDTLKSIKKVYNEANYYSHIKAIFNTILYIHNSPELCVDSSNIFSEKNSKKEAQKKIYTSKNFVILGKGFELPKEYTCGLIGVRGHFRWQPYGPERSFVKHIYIKPHTRNYSLDKNGDIDGKLDYT